MTAGIKTKSIANRRYQRVSSGKASPLPRYRRTVEQAIEDAGLKHE